MFTKQVPGIFVKKASSLLLKWQALSLARKYQTNVKTADSDQVHHVKIKYNGKTFYETGPRYEEVKNVEVTLGQMTVDHNLSTEPQISKFKAGQRTIEFYGNLVFC